MAFTSSLLSARVGRPPFKLPVLPNQEITSHLLAIYGVTLYGVEDGLCFLMRQMLDFAIDWGYIRNNPAKKVKVRKSRR